MGEGRIHDAVLSNIKNTDTNVAFNIVSSYSKGTRGTDIDGIRGTAPNICRLWAREAAPFENIVLKKEKTVVLDE